MEDCIFCKIIKGDIDSVKVYEDDEVLAFLDAFPDTEGHSLIVPKQHFENIFDIDSHILQKIVVVGQNLAIKMRQSLGAIGVHLANNNGKGAEQIVHHFHLHVIPRYEDDGLKMYGPRDKSKPASEELKKIAEKLK